MVCRGCLPWYIALRLFVLHDLNVHRDVLFLINREGNVFVTDHDANTSSNFGVEGMQAFYPLKSLIFSHIKTFSGKLNLIFPHSYSGRIEKKSAFV